MGNAEPLNVCDIVSFAFLHFFTGMMLSSLKAVGPIIEKSYGLTAVATGVIISASEIGYLSSILPVAFLASRRRRPWIIHCGAFVMVVGSLVFCLPILMQKQLRQIYIDATNETVEEFLCVTNESRTNVTTLRNTTADYTMSGDEFGDAGQSVKTLLFILGGALIGIGAGPVTTLHFSYIDDHVSRSKSPAYLSVIQTSTIVGMLSSYFIVGGFARQGTAGIPAKFDGWWIGFIVASLGCISSSCRLRCLPDVNGLCNRSIQLQENKSGPCSRVRNIFQSPSACLTLVAVACGHFAPTMNGTFIVNYMHQQFRTPLSSTSFIAGTITCVPALIGIPFGGFLLSRLDWDTKQVSRNVVLMTAIASFTLPIGCPANLVPALSQHDPFQSCRSDCDCGFSLMEVCCGGSFFLSPCYAGCSAISVESQVFTDCACVSGSVSKDLTCKRGPCDIDNICGTVKPVMFASLLAVRVFVMCICYIPLGILLMRTVRTEDKATVIALRELSGKLFGDMAGSIVTGAIFDSSCLLYSPTGSQCVLHNLASLKINYFLISTIPFICSSILLAISNSFLREFDSELL